MTTVFYSSEYYGGSCRQPPQLVFGDQSLELSSDGKLLYGGQLFALEHVGSRQEPVLRNVGGIIGTVALPARIEDYELDPLDATDALSVAVSFVYLRDELDHIRLAGLEFRLKE